MKFFIQYEGNEKVYGANTNPFDLFFEEKKKMAFDFSASICVENDFYCRWP